MHNTVTIFGQINKVDDEERIVEGIASAPVEDSQGEVISAEAMNKAIPAYMALPGGGNLREMHQPSAVGKVPYISQDEKGRTIIRAKVVDDVAWKKIKEQVYTGFSIGGRVVKKLGNVIHELKLSEISLVDRPACPDATFTLFKLDDMAQVNDLNKSIYNAVTFGQMVAALQEYVIYFQAIGKPYQDLKDAADKLRVVVEQETANSKEEFEQMLDDDAAIMLAETKLNILKALKMAKNDETPEVEEPKQEEIQEATETSKSDESADLNKQDDSNTLQKVHEQISEINKVLAGVDLAKFATVETIKSLEERLSKVENSVKPTGAMAGFVEVEKFSAPKPSEMVAKVNAYRGYMDRMAKGEELTNDERKEARALEFETRSYR